MEGKEEKGVKTEESNNETASCLQDIRNPSEFSSTFQILIGSVLPITHIWCFMEPLPFAPTLIKAANSMAPTV